jgi:hypothetical protein
MPVTVADLGFQQSEALTPTPKDVVLPFATASAA